MFTNEIDSNGCTFLHPENTVVVQVRMSRNAAVEEGDEEGEEGAEGAEGEEGATEATATE